MRLYRKLILLLPIEQNVAMTLFYYYYRIYEVLKYSPELTMNSTLTAFVLHRPVLESCKRFTGMPMKYVKSVRTLSMREHYIRGHLNIHILTMKELGTCVWMQCTFIISKISWDPAPPHVNIITT